MKKCYKTLALAVLLGMVSCLFGGCSFIKWLGKNRVMDGDGMINPAAELLDALNGYWESADARITVTIDGYEVLIVYYGSWAYNSTYTFSFDSKLDGITRTDLELDSDKIEKNIIKELYGFYIENNKLYLDITYAGTGERETIEFEKKEEPRQVLEDE